MCKYSLRLLRNLFRRGLFVFSDVGERIGKVMARIVVVFYFLTEEMQKSFLELLSLSVFQASEVKVVRSHALRVPFWTESPWAVAVPRVSVCSQSRFHHFILMPGSFPTKSNCISSESFFCAICAFD